MIFALRAACLCVCAFGGSLAAGLPACAQNLAPAGAETDAPTQRAEPVPRPRREAARPRQKNEKDARLAARPLAGAARRKASSRSGVEEANSWLIFGFSEGSDVGAKGEWTLFYDSVLRASAHAAGLGGWDGAAGIGNSPSDRAVVSIAVTPSLERNGEPIATPAAGTSWRDARGFGALASLKYQLLRRDEAPVGLAVQISPYWQHVASGAISHDTLGSEFRLLVDRVLVPNLWFAAVNLAYQPHRDAYSDGSAFNMTAFELSAAVARQVTGTVFLGAEIRYLSKHFGLLFDQWDGAALYAGPTAFIPLGAQGYFGIAWSVRIAQDASAGSAPARDAEGFDRHQLRVKAGISF
jgi:hypothetical protein